MTKLAMRHAATAALSGALAFAAATCWFTQTGTAEDAGVRVSQYCVPQEASFDSPSFDAHRLYCRNEGG